MNNNRLRQFDGRKIPVGDILPLISDSMYASLKVGTGDGEEVNIGAENLRCFKEHGIKCLCGTEGSFFRVEKSNAKGSMYSKWHLNLYANTTQGEILMTKDHIVPSSRGGEDDMSNYQTMCERCNTRKGSKLMDEWMNTATAAAPAPLSQDDETGEICEKLKEYYNISVGDDPKQQFALVQDLNENLSKAFVRITHGSGKNSNRTVYMTILRGKAVYVECEFDKNRTLHASLSPNNKMSHRNVTPLKPFNHLDTVPFGMEGKGYSVAMRDAVIYQAHKIILQIPTGLTTADRYKHVRSLKDVQSVSSPYIANVSMAIMSGATPEVISLRAWQAVDHGDMPARDKKTLGVAKKIVRDALYPIGVITILAREERRRGRPAKAKQPKPAKQPRQPKVGKLKKVKAFPPAQAQGVSLPHQTAAVPQNPNHMQSNYSQQQLHDAAMSLIQQNGQTTTKEVKESLRSQGLTARQDDVSRDMDALASEPINGLEWTPGPYRTYTTAKVLPATATVTDDDDDNATATTTTPNALTIVKEEIARVTRIVALAISGGSNLHTDLGMDASKISALAEALKARNVEIDISQCLTVNDVATQVDLALVNQSNN